MKKAEKKAPKKAIKNGLLEKVIELIDAGYPIESTDEHGRTPIERAAIHGKNGIIRYLWDKGGILGNALTMARQNAKYFPDHMQTVALIISLAKGTQEDGTE